MQREILTRTIIAGALIALVFLGILYLPSSQQQTAPYMDNYDGHAMRVELYIYKNGKLVYYDPDDPAVKNIAYLLAEFLDVDANNITAPTGQRMDGSQTWDPSDTQGAKYSILNGGTANNGVVGGTRALIIIGEDSVFTRNDYTLQTVHAMVFSDELTINITDSKIELIVGGSYTVPTDAQPINVTAVGLGTTASTPTNLPVPGTSWLLFKDLLSTPITLQPGDTIHVRYVITFP